MLLRLRRTIYAKACRLLTRARFMGAIIHPAGKPGAIELAPPDGGFWRFFSRRRRHEIYSTRLPSGRATISCLLPDPFPESLHTRDPLLPVGAG